ncbi:MAG: hypothetical protein J7K40_02095 [candidate division Zixibacteria bacterium]|nr:hypothetical protein [candidate division Zixibacteria bacterium]
MNITLNHLKSNRKWHVPNVVVWGNADSFDAQFVMVEESSSKRVVFLHSRLGGSDQLISFSDLEDASGNSLPSLIANPVVIIIPRNQAHCFLVGESSENHFKIACGQDSVSGLAKHGLVDLLIMEIDLP